MTEAMDEEIGRLLVSTGLATRDPDGNLRYDAAAHRHHDRHRRGQRDLRAQRQVPVRPDPGQGLRLPDRRVGAARRRGAAGRRGQRRRAARRHGERRRSLPAVRRDRRGEGREGGTEVTHARRPEDASLPDQTAPPRDPEVQLHAAGREPARVGHRALAVRHRFRPDLRAALHVPGAVQRRGRHVVRTGRRRGSRRHRYLLRREHA